MQCQRVAKGFAKRLGRQTDKAFLDECEAEAAYIVVKMIYTGYDAIMQKYPEREERYKFYQMSVGFQLKTYWSYRATSTVSYLAKRGIVERHFSMNQSREKIIDGDTVTTNWEHGGYLARMNIELELYILLDSVCLNEMEKTIVDCYAVGVSHEEIAARLNTTVNLVKKLLRRVKRRIRHSGDRNNVRVQDSVPTLPNGSGLHEESSPEDIRKAELGQGEAIHQDLRPDSSESLPGNPAVYSNG